MDEKREGVKDERRKDVVSNWFGSSHVGIATQARVCTRAPVFQRVTSYIYGVDLRTIATCEIIWPTVTEKQGVCDAIVKV